MFLFIKKVFDIKDVFFCLFDKGVGTNYKKILILI